MTTNGPVVCKKKELRGRACTLGKKKRTPSRPENAAVKMTQSSQAVRDARITDSPVKQLALFQARASAELCAVGQGKVMWRKPRLRAASAEKRFLLTHAYTHARTNYSPIPPRHFRIKWERFPRPYCSYSPLQDQLVQRGFVSSPDTKMPREGDTKQRRECAPRHCLQER